VLAYYDSFIQSTAGPWQLPSVICLKQYQKGCRERPPPLNRRNIYIRDHYSCAYCTQRLKANDLTLDHVMPRSKGGKGSWDNLVTCKYAFFPPSFFSSHILCAVLPLCACEKGVQLGLLLVS
jgi:hypothetical protein